MVNAFEPNKSMYTSIYQFKNWSELNIRHIYHKNTSKLFTLSSLAYTFKETLSSLTLGFSFAKEWLWWSTTACMKFFVRVIVKQAKNTRFFCISNVDYNCRINSATTYVHALIVGGPGKSPDPHRIRLTKIRY